MKILVCISHVPDTTTKIQFTEDHSGLNKAGVTFIIDPYCEYGLSRAIGFREEGKQVQITAICVGGPEVEPTLRKALAIGADDAVRINVEPSDSAFVAQQIYKFAESREYDIIFTGKESIDFNGSIVPGMLAEYMNMSFVSFATKMDMTGDKTAEVHREVDGGTEILDVTLPAVISCQKGIAEWRIPNMRGIMAARKKPLSVVNASEDTPKANTVKFDYPAAKGDCQYFEPEQSAALVAALNDKGLI
ncbi:MAG: electron transfer flavoprotein subunit beta/FixA family protein [Bacteroidota bacterium]